MGFRGIVAVSLCALVGCTKEDPRLADLANRVDQLEARLAAESKRSDVPVSGEITANKLVIVDENGRSRAMLWSGGLELWSSAPDASRASVRANNQEATIELTSRNALASMEAWHEGQVDFARVFGKSGSLESFELISDHKKSNFELMRSKANTASIGVDGKDSRLWISGADADERISSFMRFTATQRPKIETSHD